MDNSPNAARNELLEKWRKEHVEKYTAPVMEKVMVGASGITPDRKGLDNTGKEQVGEIIDEKRPLAEDEEVDEIIADVFDGISEAAERAKIDAILNDPEAAVEAARRLLESRAG